MSQWPSKSLWSNHFWRRIVCKYGILAVCKIGILIENIDRDYMVDLPVVEIIVYLVRIFVLWGRFLYYCFSETKCHSIILSFTSESKVLAVKELRQWYFSECFTEKYHKSIIGGYLGFCLKIIQHRNQQGKRECHKHHWQGEQKSARNGHGACPCWVTCLPLLGTVLAPVGQNPCMKSAQNISPNRSSDRSM